ncbi:hypothetical protein SFA35_16320 [Pseudomonas sp. HR96]|uniref:hypothetical protein n=1 Tax=Pseudomonas sp. HR96 TaxID=1027966 RepID=UPI002A75C0A4|nr:hypothetical protein [Pseudomonas sp. HR96]WPO98209.1 hypothetical protein SFA35_16320 [Pseudomonas sp. HR96]
MSILKSASLAAALCCVGSTVSAAEMDIRAEFTPDATNPSANRFVNRTPSTGYCAIYPQFCLNDLFSLIVPINTEWGTLGIGAPIADGAMIRISNEPRTVDVIADDGAVAQLGFTITHFGATYNLNPTVQTITGNPDFMRAHMELWVGSDWVNPAPGCSHGHAAVGHNSARHYTFFWRNSTGTACGKVPRHNIPNIRFTDLNIAYELVTPNPLAMSNGTYRGSATYTVGPGGDIDFGNRLQVNDDTLTFRFELKVNHILNIRFPPGAERLSLNPAGGWQRWLNSGRIPDKLTAYQDFEIWSSGNFKMQLRCEYSIAGQCAVANPAGNQVPVATRVTLPAGLTSSGGAINEHLLDEGTPLLVASNHYVDNGRARLHFEVDRNGVTQMAGQAGTQYTGDVTVIWDSDI